MNISIFAAVGCQNLGDELIVKNEMDLLRKEFGEDLRFKVASYDPQHPVFDLKDTSYFEYFPLGLKNPKNIFRNISNLIELLRVICWSNIVVIGGGGIIYDSEQQSVGSPLFQWLFRARLARFFRKKIYFYAVGIDVKQQKNLKTHQKIFQNSWKITVRDEKSRQQLSELGISSELVDDPVLSENDKRGNILAVYDSKDFYPQDLIELDMTGKRVGLALRSRYLGKSELTKLQDLCKLIESAGGKVIFMPHSIHQHDTLADDQAFMNHCMSPGREMAQDLREVYDLYTSSQIDLLISMRLHSIILSYVYGIDQIALSYSQKTQELLKKLTT